MLIEPEFDSLPLLDQVVDILLDHNPSLLTNQGVSILHRHLKQEKVLCKPWLRPFGYDPDIKQL
jgi:hypothetical protein